MITMKTILITIFVLAVAIWVSMSSTMNTWISARGIIVSANALGILPRGIHSAEASVLIADIYNKR